MEAPFLIQTDSYKAGHPLMYPELQEATAYMSCRKPLVEDDHRIVFYGIRYLYDTVISRRITMEDIEEADKWYATHGVSKTQYYYPRDLWLAVVQELDGYLPFEIQSLSEGTVIAPQVPFLQITARGKFARLVTWLEPRLTSIWSPITTATKSAMVRDFLDKLFTETVEEDLYFLLDSRLHDFGYRGVSSNETAMVTGAAHLLSFEGTDTMPAAWLATKYNNGKPIGESVLASEHSVMTSWPTELDAVKHLISIAPENSILSVVADTYDYDNFLNTILPEVAPLSIAKNLTFVIRPDSGDPVTQVLKALKAADKCFGSVVNSKGYKQLTGAAVIQGDGLDLDRIKEVATAVKTAGYSAACVAYGMGGGLLQKQSRDTLSVATKLNHVIYQNGVQKNCMKHPVGDKSKYSLPGKTVVVMDFSFWVSPLLKVVPENKKNLYPSSSTLLLKIWDNGPTPYIFDMFSEIRETLAIFWRITPKTYDPISPELKELIAKELER